MNWSGGAPVPSFNVSQDATSHYISVTGSVTANLPLMMMGMLGFSSTNVGVTAAARRRAVNIVMVLDHSGPLLGAPLSALQTDAGIFVNMFVNGTDNIGLVTFTGAPYVPDPLVPGTVNSLPQIQTDINSMAVPGGSSTTSVTNPSAALWAAYQQLQAVNQPGALNAIVLFIGTAPGAFSGNFAGLLKATNYCSPLSASPLDGVIWVNQYQTAIGGLADPTATSINDTPENRGAPPYCSADTLIPNRFLTGMPSTDLNGNSTNGTGTISTYASVNLNSVTKINIAAASENALDDAANRIRSDATLTPVIFAIGLGSNLYPQPDSTLMLRVANDPTSASYNSSQPSGSYSYAPTSTQLQSAFSGIGSQVLQLAK
jgi:hypothetical protein